MNWIRIAVGITRDPRIIALSEAVGVSVPTTTGHVVGVLTALPEGADTGDLSRVSDATLEQWAMWRGRRGVFAAAFRAQLCDEQGVVRAWERHNGAEIRRAKAAALRARAWREERKANAPANAERTRTVRVANAERTALRDETRRNYESQSTSDSQSSRQSSSSRARSSDVKRAVELLSHAGVTQTPAAFQALLAAVPNPLAWGAAMAGMTQGQGSPGGRPVSAPRLAIAVADFLAAGRHLERPSLGLFRKFVEKAADPVSPAKTHHLNAVELKATELRELRECNVFLRNKGRPPKPEPTWAAEIDAQFPDGRTLPELRESAA